MLHAKTQMLLAAAIAIRNASPVAFAARALRIGCAARPATLSAHSGMYVEAFHRYWFQPLVYQKLVAAPLATVRPNQRNVRGTATRAGIQVRK